MRKVGDPDPRHCSMWPKHQLSPKKANNEITPISRATTVTKRDISSLIAAKRKRMKRTNKIRRTLRVKQPIHM